MKRKTLPKAQRTRGLSSAYQSNKFLHKSWSNSKFNIFRPNFNFITSPSLSSKILTKLQFQNLAWTLTSKYWPKLPSESRLRSNFITFTKHQQKKTGQTPAPNLAWTSTSKSWPNLVLKVWTKVELFDQTSASKSATNCCQHNPHQQQLQHQQVLSWHLHTTGVTSVKFTKQEWVSQWVSYKGKQWSDSGPIKINQKHRQKKARKLMIFDEQTDGERNSNAARILDSETISDTVCKNTMFLKGLFCYQS